MFHSSLRRNECSRQGPLFLLPGSRLLREGRCLSWVVGDALAVRRSCCLPWTRAVFNLLLTEVSSICGVLLVFCVQENDSIHVSLFRCFPHFKLLRDIECSSVLYGKPFLSCFRYSNVYLDFTGGSGGEVSTCIAGASGSIPGSGRPPGEGHGNSSILAWRIPWIEECDGLTY